MAFYAVEVWDKAFYPCIEADSPEQAELIACEWFSERNPATKIFVPFCDKCYHHAHEDEKDSISCCNCCEEYSFFEPMDS